MQRRAFTLMETMMVLFLLALMLALATVGAGAIMKWRQNQEAKQAAALRIQAVIVMYDRAGITPEMVWIELCRRELVARGLAPCPEPVTTATMQQHLEALGQTFAVPDWTDPAAIAAMGLVEPSDPREYLLR